MVYTKDIINKILLIQIVFFVLIAVIIGICFKFNTALSFFLGATVWILPNAFFTIKMLNAKIQIPNKFIKKFYLFECAKLVISFLLIVLCLKLFVLNLISFIAGYIASIFLAILLPVLIIFRKKSA